MEEEEAEEEEAEGEEGRNAGRAFENSLDPRSNIFVTLLARS